jgi:hypothetical protein
MADVVLNFTPRRQFVPFHQRAERFACIATHHRAGKTVACMCDDSPSASVGPPCAAAFPDTALATN